MPGAAAGTCVCCCCWDLLSPSFLPLCWSLNLFTAPNRLRCPPRHPPQLTQQVLSRLEVKSEQRILAVTLQDMDMTQHNMAQHSTTTHVRTLFVPSLFPSVTPTHQHKQPLSASKRKHLPCRSRTVCRASHSPSSCVRRAQVCPGSTQSCATAHSLAATGTCQVCSEKRGGGAKREGSHEEMLLLLLLQSAEVCKSLLCLSTHTSPAASRDVPCRLLGQLPYLALPPQIKQHVKQSRCHCGQLILILPEVVRRQHSC